LRCWSDNASCESFFKTLKREEIYAHKYEDLEHLRANIEEFIEEYYNRQRLHSALGYRSPEEFERKAEDQAESRGARMESFVNKENDEKISKGLLGTGTPMSSPSPDPFSGEKMQEHFYKNGNWVQKGCAILGVHPSGSVRLWSQWSRIRRS